MVIMASPFASLVWCVCASCAALLSLRRVVGTFAPEAVALGARAPRCLRVTLAVGRGRGRERPAHDAGSVDRGHAFVAEQAKCCGFARVAGDVLRALAGGELRAELRPVCCGAWHSVNLRG